jgi:carboxypeptidase Q
MKLLLLTTAYVFASSYTLPAHVAKDIAGQQAAVTKIVHAATTTPFAGSTWLNLSRLVDTHGHRLLGSVALNASIDWLLNATRADGLYSWTEETVPHYNWTRGSESAFVTAPLMPGGRQLELKILSLGFSSGTPAEGVTAQICIAHDWTELTADRCGGRIAVLVPVWLGYGNTVGYRGQAATRAHAVGAKAVIVRTMASFSLGNPHTGFGFNEFNASAQMYNTTAAFSPIPTVAAAVEDVEMLDRMVNLHGLNVSVRLTLLNTGKLPAAWATSRCVLAQINGTERPQEVVLLSGHLDSWDVGQGALDDGAGMAISWKALALIAQLKLRPRRTLRFVAWAGEETGEGATQYWRNHANGAAGALGLNETHVLAAESDSGVFEARAWMLDGSVGAHAYARAIGELITSAGGMGATATGGEGEDIDERDHAAVPGASLRSDANAWFRYPGQWDATGLAGAKFQGDYFMYHHSVADTMSMLDPGQLDRAVATWAAFGFAIANLESTLPRADSAADIVADDAALLAALGTPPAGGAPQPAVCGVHWTPPPPPAAGCPRVAKKAGAFAWIIVVLSTALVSATAARVYTLHMLRRGGLGGAGGGAAARRAQEEVFFPYASLLTPEELRETELPTPHELEAAALAQSAAPRPPVTM